MNMMNSDENSNLNKVNILYEELKNHFTHRGVLAWNPLIQSIRDNINDLKNNSNNINLEEGIDIGLTIEDYEYMLRKAINELKTFMFYQFKIQEETAINPMKIMQVGMNYYPISHN